MFDKFNFEDASKAFVEFVNGRLMSLGEAVSKYQHQYHLTHKRTMLVLKLDYRCHLSTRALFEYVFDADKVQEYVDTYTKMGYNIVFQDVWK